MVRLLDLGELELLEIHAPAVLLGNGDDLTLALELVRPCRSLDLILG